MEKQKVIEVIKNLKENAKDRKFSQSVDFILTIKDLNLKQVENQVEFFGTLPFQKKKAVKICVLGSSQMESEAKTNCDNFISEAEFPKYTDKKLAKKLASDYDFFIAQADLMAKIAQTFGRVFGPRKKMPNPKAGCVVPGKASLKGIVEKLRKTQKFSIKVQPFFSFSVGDLEMSDDNIAENVISAYTQIERALPQGRNNVKAAKLKLTMSKPVSLEF